MFEIRTVSGMRHWVDDLNVTPDGNPMEALSTRPELVGFVAARTTPTSSIEKLRQQAQSQLDNEFIGANEYVNAVWINVKHIESITDFGDRYR